MFQIRFANTLLLLVIAAINSNINADVDVQMRQNQQRLRELDHAKFLKQLEARDRKKPFIGKMVITDELKFEFLKEVTYRE